MNFFVCVMALSDVIVKRELNVSLYLEITNDSKQHLSTIPFLTFLDACEKIVGTVYFINIWYID
jgi:hypothetical protein